MLFPNLRHHPYLAVFGMAIADKYIAQRLTGLEWLGMSWFFENEDLDRVAQALEIARNMCRMLLRTRQTGSRAR